MSHESIPKQNTQEKIITPESQKIESHIDNNEILEQKTKKEIENLQKRAIELNRVEELKNELGINVLTEEQIKEKLGILDIKEEEQIKDYKPGFLKSLAKNPYLAKILTGLGFFSVTHQEIQADTSKNLDSNITEARHINSSIKTFQEEANSPDAFHFGEKLGPDPEEDKSGDLTGGSKFDGDKKEINKEFKKEKIENEIDKNDSKGGLIPIDESRFIPHNGRDVKEWYKEWLEKRKPAIEKLINEHNKLYLDKISAYEEYLKKNPNVKFNQEIINGFNRSIIKQTPEEFLKNINDKVQNTPEYKSFLKLFVDGQYLPDDKFIQYNNLNKFIDPNVRTHELSHSADDYGNYPTKLGDLEEKIINKVNIFSEKKRSRGLEKNIYLNTPTEIKARLNEFRQSMNLDPNKNYNINEFKTLLKNWISLSGAEVIKSMFTPEELLELHNSTVYNEKQESQDQIQNNLESTKENVT